jgi:hypothetical protein
MADRYLLYIDILGFSDLVMKEPSRVEDLYEVIASLEVHNHDAFSTIIFSDTILVYNLVDSSEAQDQVYVIMYLCEFVQDLIYRLAGRDIFFRALITRGNFNHYMLNDIQCYFGQALIDAYQREKTIKCVGLFIDRKLLNRNPGYLSTKYNDQTSFVFLTQNLERVEDTYRGMLPLPDVIALDTDLCHYLGPEILMIRDIREHSLHHPVEEVRAKYLAAWKLYKKAYPETLSKLEENDFDLRVINPRFDWSKLLSRLPEDCSWASTRIDLLLPE